MTSLTTEKYFYDFCHKQNSQLTVKYLKLLQKKSHAFFTYHWKLFEKKCTQTDSASKYIINTY